MKTPIHLTWAVISLALAACQPAGTATSGALTTAGHAAQGIGRTARTAGTGIAHTVGNTAQTAGEGVAEGDLKKSTIGTAQAAGRGTGRTAVATGRSHLKTTSGVLKDTGNTLNETGEAMKDE